MPNGKMTQCLVCETGHAGVDGRCAVCPAGRTPDAEHQRCEVCPAGTAGTGGDCSDCGAGTQPNAGRMACEGCDAGTYSASGSTCADCVTAGFYTPDGITCVVCAAGTTPNSDRTGCVNCADNFAGTGGLCTQCAAGKSPTAGRASCAACAAGKAGVGQCQRCPAGEEPDQTRGRCTRCPEGKYSDGKNASQCQPCLPKATTVPSDNRAECLCRPGYYSYITDDPTQDAATGLSDAIQNCRACPTLEENQFDGHCPGGRPAANQTGTGFAVVYPGENFWINERWAKEYALQTFKSEKNLRNHSCETSTVPHCLGHEWRENKVWGKSLPDLTEPRPDPTVDERMCTGTYNVTAPYFCKYNRFHSRQVFTL
jgi:hypothetical protein